MPLFPTKKATEKQNWIKHEIVLVVLSDVFRIFPFYKIHLIRRSHSILYKFIVGNQHTNHVRISLYVELKKHTLEAWDLFSRKPLFSIFLFCVFSGPCQLLYYTLRFFFFGRLCPIVSLCIKWNQVHAILRYMKHLTYWDRDPQKSFFFVEIKIANDTQMILFIHMQIEVSLFEVFFSRI